MSKRPSRPKNFVYPDNTVGAKAARRVRAEANKLTEQQREDLFKRGMQIVYGGTGRAARDWPAFHAIVRCLRELENDETLLIQSGKPVGVFRTHAEAPRVREAFNQAVEQGRARLYPCLEEIAGVAMQWFTEARAVRRSIDDATLKGSAHVAEESRGHLQRLLNATTLQSLSDGWLRQLPRYLKAEERRWQRIAARGAEPPQIVRELDARSARYDSLAMQLAAELRWLPQLDELRGWMEEYRVSLYAQELKTLGPVSAARLEARAAEIEAWIAR